MAYPRWDVQASDVPGGRVTRSVAAGLDDLKEERRNEVIEERKDALDRLREAAGSAATEELRHSIWELVPTIGSGEGYPSWDEVVGAHTLTDFRLLATKAEGQSLVEDQDAVDRETSELRTMSHGVEEYLGEKERVGISATTLRQNRSILGRACEVSVPGSSATFREQRIVTLNEGDAELILDEMTKTDDARCENGRVEPNTAANFRKTLRAWFNWEIKHERRQARLERRDPLFTENPFEEVDGPLIQPVKGRHQTVEQAETNRRFRRDEADALIETAETPRLEMLFHLSRVLGSRPGEPRHLRWLEDVRPLTEEEGDGYRIDIQGGRGRDPRCSCTQCQTAAGWAPKNGPRSYVLNRGFDQIGWLTSLCDKLDKWLAMLDPDRGDFILPSPKDSGRTWTNQSMNRKLHATADRLRESGVLPEFETGQATPRGLTMHSWRHTCASEMLEEGIPDALAANWIGDSLKEFRDTYGAPDPHDMARATFADHS